MKSISPLLHEGTSKADHYKNVASALEEEAKKRSISRNRLRKEGVHQKSLTGRCDFSRLCFAKALSIIGVDGECAERLESIYVGRKPENCREYLQAHLRLKEDVQQFVTRIGNCTVSNIHRLLRRPELSKNQKGRSASVMNYALWSEIAHAIGLDPLEAHEMWLRDTRAHLRLQGANPLRVEVETLVMEQGITKPSFCQKWESESSQKLGLNALRRFLQNLRSGQAQPQILVREICRLYHVDSHREGTLLWAMREVVAQGDKTEGRVLHFIKSDPLLFSYCSAWPDASTIIFDAVKESILGRSADRPRICDEALQRVYAEHPAFHAYQECWYWHRWQKDLRVILEKAMKEKQDINEALKEPLNQMAVQHQKMQRRHA